MIRLILKLLLVFLLLSALILGLVSCAVSAVLHGGAAAIQARLTRWQYILERVRTWWFSVRAQLPLCAVWA